MSIARFKVDKVQIDGAKEATMTIDRGSTHQMVEVRPKNKRTTYKLPLRVVVEMIAWRVARERRTR